MRGSLLPRRSHGPCWRGPPGRWVGGDANIAGPGDALASFIQIPAALQDQFQWVPVGVSGVVAYVVRCGRGDAENRPL